MGIYLNVNGAITHYKIVLSCVTRDNLFLNGMLGFVESFLAPFPCLHCLLKREKFREVFCKQLKLVRKTKSCIAATTINIDVQNTGIKLNSKLNLLCTFHASLNYIQDIMHDTCILKGVCKYDIVLKCS